MSSIGTGYDLSATTFSPDGRVFQVEYASKAVENSRTVIGVRVKDGVVLGVEKLLVSKMLVEESNRRTYALDRHIGMATSGLTADARQIVNRARQESKNYKSFYQDEIPVKVLAGRTSQFIQMYTLYAHMRPFGVSTILAGVDKFGPQLYLIDPSGVSWGYFGCAAGKGKQAAKTELEKLKLSELTCQEAVFEVARIIYMVHDEVKDKEFELELAWVTKDGYQVVPKSIHEAAEKAAKAKLSEADMDDD